MSVDEARDLAELHLAEALPRRWAHVQAVGHAAVRVTPLVRVDGDLLVAAAWLHDIGYGPSLVDTGFHPLDGARFLRRVGAVERLVCLVAHHSAALIEADERGLVDVLGKEFEREESATADALWYCDLTTGPDGQRCLVHERLSEIEQRYGPEDPVTCFVERARPVLVAAVERTEAGLIAAGLA